MKSFIKIKNEAVRMKIELLFAPNCSSRDETENHVHSIVAELSPESEITITMVDSPEKAQELGFPGSPTIRINGHDLEHEADKAVSFGLG